MTKTLKAKTLKAKTLKESDKAPAFKMATAEGPAALKDFAGKALVLYFYPKDDTSGCTTEALQFTALAKDFAKAGATVLGVSKDTVAKHEKFVAKHDLKVRLGSDEDGKVCEAYGVWIEKSMYGRKYMGIDRSTFLIDGKGVIQKLWRKVKAPGHAQEVLGAVKAL